MFDKNDNNFKWYYKNKSEVILNNFKISKINRSIKE